MSDLSNYDMGYEDGYGQAISGSDGPAPVLASYFRTVDEWDEYLDGYYTGKNDAYALMAEEATYAMEMSEYYD